MAITVDPDVNFVQYRTSYMDRALSDPMGIVADMRASMKGIKYDTIVATGSSGGLIAPIAARALRKNFLIVRKREEYESSHSGMRWLGKLGKRWIFLDDFCSSGATFRRVRDSIRFAVEQANLKVPENRYNNRTQTWEKIPGRLTFETELIGYFEYERAGWHAWDETARPGYAAVHLNDAPCYPRILEDRKREEENREAALRYYRDQREERQAERKKMTATPITFDSDQQGLAEQGVNALVAQYGITAGALSVGTKGNYIKVNSL